MKSFANIDLFFFDALMRSDEIREMCGDRIFHSLRGSTAEKQDKIPYIIVVAGKATSDGDTMDDGVAQIDTAMCSILCVADGKNYAKAAEALANLTTAVTTAIESAYDDAIWNEHDDWDFSISSIKPDLDDPDQDTDKPVQFRWINYLCKA